jgi:integrase
MMKNGILKTTLKNGRPSWGYIFEAAPDQEGRRRQVKRLGFKTEREAIAARRDAVGDREKGLDVPDDSSTFGSFFREWLDQHGVAHWGKATREANEKRAAYAIRMFGDVPLQKLTSMRIEQDLGALLARGGIKTKKHPKGNPLSPKTVRATAALVSQALDRAVRWRKIERNPMTDVVRPPAQKREIDFIQPDGYEKYLSRVQGTRYYALSVFAADCGCRRGEQLALQWTDINPKSGVVTISKSVSETKDGLEIKVPKSRKSRFVRISETTINVLAEHRAQLVEEKRLFGSDYRDNDLVFPTPDGSYYRPKQVTGRICKFMQQAGVSGSLHSLRHFSASMMLSQHVPITVVSKRLGHANSQITLDVYSHAMKHDEETAAILWEEATGGIVARTRKQPSKETAGEAGVTFRDSGKGLFVVNE